MEDPIATLQQQCREQLQYLQNEQLGVQRLAQELTSQRDKLQDKLDTASQTEAHAKSLEAKALALLEDNRNKKLQLAQQEVAHAAAQKVLEDKTQECLAQQQALDEREQRLQAFQLKIAEHYNLLLALNDQLRTRVATVGQQHSGEGEMVDALQQQMTSDNQQQPVDDAEQVSEPLQLKHWRWLCQQQIQDPDTIQRQLRLLSTHGASDKGSRDVGVQACLPKTKNPQAEANRQEAQKKAASKAQRRREHEERMRQQKEQKRLRQQKEQSQSPGIRQYGHKPSKQTLNNGNMQYQGQYDDQFDRAAHYTSDHLLDPSQQAAFYDHGVENGSYGMHSVQAVHEYQTPEGAGYNHIPTPSQLQGSNTGNGWIPHGQNIRPQAWASGHENGSGCGRAHAYVDDGRSGGEAKWQAPSRFASPANSSMQLDQHQQLQDLTAQQHVVNQGAGAVNQQAARTDANAQSDGLGVDNKPELVQQQQEDKGRKAGLADMEQRSKQKHKKGQQPHEGEPDSNRKRKRKSEKLQRSDSPRPDSKSPRVDANPENDDDKETVLTDVVDNPQPAVQRRDSRKGTPDHNQLAVEDQHLSKTVTHITGNQGGAVPPVYDGGVVDVKVGLAVDHEVTPSEQEAEAHQGSRQPSIALLQSELPSEPQTLHNPQNHDRYRTGWYPEGPAGLPRQHASLLPPVPDDFNPPHDSWGYGDTTDSYWQRDYPQHPQQWHTSHNQPVSYHSHWDVHEQDMSTWPGYANWQQQQSNMQSYAWHGHASDHTVPATHHPPPPPSSQQQQPFPQQYDRGKPPRYNGRHTAHPSHPNSHNNKPWQKQPYRGHVGQNQDTRHQKLHHKVGGARAAQLVPDKTAVGDDMKQNEEQKPAHSHDASMCCDRPVPDAVQTFPAVSQDQVPQPAGGNLGGAHVAPRRKFAPTGDGKGRTLLPGKKQANKLLAQRQAQESLQDLSDTESLQRLVQQFRKEEQTAQQSV